MQMRFLRLEKGFDGPGYLAVFDCEDTIGTQSRTWQMKYTRKQVEQMMKHPHLGAEMQRVFDLFPSDP